MRKTILCVIAHPDDEAFGPSGTLAILAKTHDVHIVCVTDGESDPKFHPQGGNLAKLRSEELQASAKILGITNVHFLHFKDGSLNNNSYHDVAKALTTLCEVIKPSLLVTYEFRGVSGHLDHVAVSLITSYVYRQNRSIEAIWYYCTDRKSSNLMGKYFVFFPPGFDKASVDLVVNIRSVFGKKVAAAKCHMTQYKDGLRIIAKWLLWPKEEWFFVDARTPFSFL